MTLVSATAIEDALISWLGVVHPGVEAVLGWPNAPRPDLPYIAVRVEGLDPIGQDDRSEIDDDGLQTIYGDRLVNVKIDAYGSGALDLVRAIANSIWRQSVSATLLAAGLCPRLPGPVTDLTGMLETSPEDRAHVEMVFGILDTYTDDVGIIDAVDGDGDVVKPDGTTLAVQVDGSLA